MNAAIWLIAAAAICALTAAVLTAQAADDSGKATNMNAAKPDYAKLKLAGNGHTQDSFSLAVCAAAGLLAKEAEYETVYCVSSNAFAPAIDMDESCTAWWHVEGWMFDRAMPAVAARLGLRAERVELPPDGLSPADPKEVFERKALAHRKAVAAVLRSQMAAGKVLLTSGGWRVRTPEHGFVPWCWWGIITRAEEDGTIAGAALKADPGRAGGVSDHPLDHVGRCWALSVGEAADAPHEADLRMLRAAVERIRGEGSFVAVGRARYGLAAMERWIGQMGKVPFCPDCKDKSWTCAADNNQTAIAGAKAAAAFLRKRAEAFAADVRPHLEAAAKRYDAIVQLLTPALTGEGGPRYRDFLGDAEKQNAYAKTLGQVEAEYAAAGDEMQAAFVAENAALAKARVRREGDKVWIDGVTGYSFAQRSSSPHAAMETVMRAVGEGVAYEDLVGASGLAFRAQLHQEWCPSSPHPWCGFQCIRGSVDLLPWRVKAVEVKADDAAGVAKARAAVVASIDAGVPCAYGSIEDGVIVGYQKAGAEWLCVHPFKGGKQFVETKWPWGIGIYPGRKDKAPDARAIALAALRQAVRMAGTKNVDKYDCGLHAWEQWIARLRDEPGIAAALEKKQPAQQGNAWTYECLVTYRRCATAYLRHVAPLFEKPAAGHLAKAADLYEQMVARHLNPEGTCTTRIAPYAEGPAKSGVPWDQASRTAQADRMAAALPLEKQAIAEIEQALAAAGGGAGGGAGLQANVRRADGRVWLDGYKPSGMEMSQPGDLVAAARYLGLQASDAWLYGATGFAFAMNVGPDLCPSGPSAWADHELLPLAANAGLRVAGYHAAKGKPDFAAKQKEAFEKVRTAIDAGMPVIGCGFDVPEVYLVAGYDDGGNYLFIDFDGKTKPFPHAKLGFIWLEFPAPTKPADDRTTVREALHTAVDLSAGKHGDKTMGLAAYANWLAGLKEGKPESAFGSAYNAACWAECRRNAVAFLKEAKSRLADAKLNELFDEAIKRYAVVSGKLDEVSKLLPLFPGEDKRTAEVFQDAARRDKAAKAVAAARDAEVIGLKAVARLAVALGAKDVNPDLIGARRDADHPPVLLTRAVRAFEHMQKDIASHKDLAEGSHRYPQPCVYLQMHWVEMRTAGFEDVDFDQLCAVSGASGLFAYEPKEFMPKYANLSIGMDRRIAEATGFGYQWLQFADAQEAWRIIHDGIDAGRPLKGWHLENCAFVGYQDAARDEDRRLYVIGDGPGTFSTWWTWQQFTDWVAMVGKWHQQSLGRHTKRVEPLAAAEVARRVMQDLVAWATDPPAECVKRFPKATFGLAGMAAYADDCANVAQHKDWVMCHDINPQWTVRNSTAVYLGRVAESGVFGKEVSARVAEAAKEYQAAFAAWHKCYGLLGHGATDEQRQDKQRREAGAALVREASRHEAAAIAKLQAALAAAPAGGTTGSEGQP